MTDRTSELRVVSASVDGVTATLELVDHARRSLAAARTLPDIRRVMEVASVAVDAAQRAARLAEAQRAAAEVVEAAGAAANEAAAVRIEAQAHAGELLRQMSAHGDRRRAGETYQPGTSLSDLGVTRNESSRWQRVASVPADLREAYVETTRTAGGEVSTAGLLRHAHAVQHADGGSTDHAAIGAAARKRMRAVFRCLVELADHRPEALVLALDRGERRDLLRAIDQLPAWIADVRVELDVHRVSTQE